MGSIRSLLALAAIAAVVGACGGSSGTAAPKATAAASAAGDGADVEASAGSEGSGDSDTSGAGLPKIEDATYKSGTATVKITGEKSLDLSGEIADSGALTIGGATVLQYALPSDGGFVQISFLQDDSDSSGSGIAIADGDFVVAGTWGEDCDVTFSRNDGSGLAGDFVCKGLTGADTKLAKAYAIDIAGSFKADK